MNPWAMLGLLILCLIVVCLYVKFWADIISPGPDRQHLPPEEPRMPLAPPPKPTDSLQSVLPPHGMRDGQDWHRDG